MHPELSPVLRQHRFDELSGARRYRHQFGTPGHRSLFRRRRHVATGPPDGPVATVVPFGPTVRATGALDFDDRVA